MQPLHYNEKVTYRVPGFPLAFYYVDNNFHASNLPFHWHPQAEILYVISGTYTYTIDGTVKTANEGNVVYYNSGVLHGTVRRDGIYASIVFDPQTLLISTDRVRDIIRFLTSDDIKISDSFPSDDIKLKKITHSLVRSLQNGIVGHELDIVGDLFLFYAHIYDAHYYYTTNEAHSPTVKKMLRIRPILSFIEDHFMQPITIDSLSKVSGMTPKYLSSQFKAVTKMTPVEYLNYYRIEQACMLLTQTDEPITEIAFRCGFNDSSYFVRVFKVNKHITPLKYRKNVLLDKKTVPEIIS